MVHLRVEQVTWMTWNRMNSYLCRYNAHWWTIINRVFTPTTTTSGGPHNPSSNVRCASSFDPTWRKISSDQNWGNNWDGWQPINAGRSRGISGVLTVSFRAFLKMIFYKTAILCWVPISHDLPKTAHQFTIWLAENPLFTSIWSSYRWCEMPHCHTWCLTLAVKTHPGLSGCLPQVRWSWSLRLIHITN